ncbi:MAG: hypothetical protein ACK5CY_00670 [Bacteroidia bacterium]|jgi:hypothetical protein
MKYFLIGLMVLLTIHIVDAQDTIYLKNKDTITARVAEIDAYFISYSLNNIDSIILLLPKHEVARIVYANGTADVFLENEVPVESFDFYGLGYSDAERYYNSKPDFAKGVIDGVLTYVFYSGIVLVIIDYRKEPRADYPKDLGFTNTNEQNKEYRRGYTDGARRLKNRKLVGGYFIGLLAMPIVLTGILVGVAAGM